MPHRPFTDGVDRHVDVDAVTEHVRVPAFAVADVRRLEAIELLDACGALHRDGVLDDHEYEAKRAALAGGLAVAERGGRR